MTKDVILSVRGLQMMPENGSDSVEVIAPGKYYYKNDKHFFLYDEVLEGFEEKTRNMVKAAPGYMELTKDGLTSVHMVFEKNKKHVTYYYTPYGSLLIGIDATKVEVFEKENEIRLEVEYGLEINNAYVADCHIQMEAKPKDSKEFHLTM